MEGKMNDQLRPQGVTSNISTQLFRNYDDNIPRDLVDCERKITALKKQKMEIQSQVSNPNWTDEDGCRISPKQYYRYRHKLTSKLSNIDRELMDLKEWQKRAKSALRDIPTKPVLQDIPSKSLSDFESEIFNELIEIKKHHKTLEKLIGKYINLKSC